jgi:hypothetical protein
MSGFADYRVFVEPLVLKNKMEFVGIVVMVELSEKFEIGEENICNWVAFLSGS